MLQLGRLVLVVMPTVVLFVCGCGIIGNTSKNSTLEVVSSVDINRYLGTWYEIARYPNRFQKNCLNSKAIYTMRNDGNINVVNQCSKIDEPGKIKEAKGKAWVVDKNTNAKLKVSFFWPFSGDYWIIQLSPDYSYAVVGHPERKYLWILAREPVIDRELYAKVIQGISKQEYNPDKLIISSRQTEYLNSLNE